MGIPTATHALCVCPLLSRVSLAAGDAPCKVPVPGAGPRKNLLAYMRNLLLLSHGRPKGPKHRGKEDRLQNDKRGTEPKEDFCTQSAARDEGGWPHSLERTPGHEAQPGLPGVSCPVQPAHVLQTPAYIYSRLVKNPPAWDQLRAPAYCVHPKAAGVTTELARASSAGCTSLPGLSSQTGSLFSPTTSIRMFLAWSAQ